MDLNEARTLLNESTRQQIGDRETGAFEIYWSKDDQEVASGWFEGNPDNCHVWFVDSVTFTGSDAKNRRYCGKSGGTEYMQDSNEEQERKSLARWSQLAQDHPYDPSTGGGIIIDIDGELYTGRYH